MAITHPQPIICDGKEFASVKEFANYYGLNYSKVQYYRKKGKSAEDIVQACQFTSASKSTEPPKPSKKRFVCEYNGIEYSSLYEAANALGLSPAQVYEFRKRNNLSASEAIRLSVEKRMEKGKGPARVSKKCVVDGVEYESREAAIKAYGIPRVTIYSRMKREGIPFEEALSRGKQASVYCPPTMSLFSSLRLVPAEHDMKQPILKELAASFDFYKRKIECKQDFVTKLPVLVVDENSFLFFNHDAHGLEIVSILPIHVPLETLNILNGSYANTKVFYNSMTNQTILSAFQMAKEEGQDIKPLLYAYFSFAAIRDKLLLQYAPSSQEQPAVKACFNTSTLVEE